MLSIFRLTYQFMRPKESGYPVPSASETFTHRKSQPRNSVIIHLSLEFGANDTRATITRALVAAID
jgi:hypothetical protein